MSRHAATLSPEEAAFRRLEAEFIPHIEDVRRKWMQENNRIPMGAGLYELDPQEQNRVKWVIAAWERYITPIAEAWWRERGYEIIWPEQSSDPCTYRKLVAA